MAQAGGNSRNDLPIEEALDELRVKIDKGADKLKDAIGTGVHQLSAFIDSADRVVEQVMTRVEDAAEKTDEAIHTAERMAENLEHPIEYVKKYPLQAFGGAFVAGILIGLYVRRLETGGKEERRLRLARSSR